ncbi:LysR family transcriptional regulator [Sphaerotilus hippei]|uniref:LysR family transcriptional regulator n=1 Tax=Sphaerotilus hippei TaxID=744406 RepID=A0A318GWA0_9BURK|nr:LysR family transcriptional regulator [Sphaerotilus hippei]PXW93834.1 LysR family transcriptional regulator [Sphaerotilus hippei]
MNFRTLDLNLLRVFDVVMAERNLTRAAEQLSMTQPAVSNALRRLRETVGETLFTRGAQGVVPTARAEALWPEVRVALAHLRDAFEPTTYDPRTQPLTGRLAMADAVAARLLPVLLRRLESSQAMVDLRVLPLLMRDPSTLLERGEADLAIGHFPELVTRMVTLGSSAPLRQRQLEESEYVCVMRRGHPLAGEEALTLEAYCAAQHLLVSFSGRAHGVVDEVLVGMQRSRRVVLAVNQFYTAGLVIAATDLLTVLPRAYLSVIGAAEALVSRPLPLRLAPLLIHMVWHRRHDTQPAHRWLLEQVAAASSPQPAAGADSSVQR